MSFDVTKMRWHVDSPEKIDDTDSEVVVYVVDSYGYRQIAAVNDCHTDWLDVAEFISHAPDIRRQRDQLKEVVEECIRVLDKEENQSVLTALRDSSGEFTGKRALPVSRMKAVIADIREEGPE